MFQVFISLQKSALLHLHWGGAFVSDGFVVFFVCLGIGVFFYVNMQFLSRYLAWIVHLTWTWKLPSLLLNPSSRGAFNVKPGETSQLLSAGATWKSLFLRCNEAVCQMSRLPLLPADNLFICLQA